MGINAYLIGFMVIFFTLTLGLFAARAKKIESVPLDYSPFGRDFSLLTAMILLFVFGVIVMFWASLPLITGWFSEET